MQNILIPGLLERELSASGAFIEEADQAATYCVCRGWWWLLYTTRQMIIIVGASLSEL